MCDYSLEAYQTRPAVKGERYVLERFRSGSMGFTTTAGCSTAVCIPADTRLRLEGISAGLQQRHGVGAVQEAVMTRNDSGWYRDGVVFPNGQEVILQNLNPGVTAIVLALVGDEMATERSKAPELERIEL